MRSSSKRPDPMVSRRKHSIILRMMLIAIRISNLGKISIIEITLPRRIWTEKIEKKILLSRKETQPEKNRLKNSLQSMISV